MNRPPPPSTSHPNATAHPGFRSKKELGALLLSLYVHEIRLFQGCLRIIPQNSKRRIVCIQFFKLQSNRPRFPQFDSFRRQEHEVKRS